MKKIYAIRIESCYNGEHTIDVSDGVYEDIVQASKELTRNFLSDVRESWLCEYKVEDIVDILYEDGVIKCFYLRMEDENYYIANLKTLELK